MSDRIFHQRRAQLIEHLPERGLALIPAAQEVTRSRDTEYPFRQDSDYWYLTGCKEPDGLLVLSREKSLLFVLPKDPKMEVWTGLRLGPEAAVAELGVDAAWPLEALDEQLPLLLQGASEVWLPLDDLQLYSRFLSWRQQLPKHFKKQAQPPERLVDVRACLAEMRLRKSPEEIDLLKKAVAISADGHRRALAACRPGLMEYQLQAEIEHEFAMQGAAAPAYASIVGGGANACVLHYIANHDPLQAGDLVLIDAGAEYQGYAGDITRTFPVSGRFTAVQKQLYAWVLQANEAVIAQVRPGVTLEDLHQIAVRTLVAGLVDLGILQGEPQQLIKDEAYKPYYMHGTGHWLGLDVHDVGRYHLEAAARPLEPGMVFTVEPGLYFAPDATSVAACWRGLGIRIEDDLLVTETGCEVLSASLPKSPDALEALMAAETPFGEKEAGDAH